MSTIKTFKIPSKIFKTLTLNERKLLPILVKAAKGADKIFARQENDKYKGANFYPQDVTREKIESAARLNHKILSPFTIVREDKSGKLIAVDFHIEYAPFIAPIVVLLAQAADLSQNKSFKNYLKVLAKSLVDGNYQKADIAWLEVKGSNLDIVIGPHERYLDKLFFIKRAYQASVGLVDRSLTKKAKVIRDILYLPTRQHPQRITPPSIVDMQVQHCLVFSGFLARVLFTRQHLPSDSDTTQRYGSRIIGYLSVIDYKFEKLIYPIFNAVFEKNFKASYSKDLLKRGNYYYVLLIAIAQQLHRYQNSRLRLKELFPIFDEANSVASGIAHAKQLVLKGVIDQKELEAIIISTICWIFSEWILNKKTNIREDYLKGDALNFNFLLRQGALQEKEGVSWPNFAKIFFEMENLAVIFVRLLEEGEYPDAQEFISKYLTFEQFRSFDKRLSQIKPL